MLCILARNVEDKADLQVQIGLVSISAGLSGLRCPLGQRNYGADGEAKVPLGPVDGPVKLGPVATGV